jgi:hypothetical protein
MCVCVCVWYRAHFFLEWEMFKQTENQNTHFIFDNLFLKIVGKCGVVYISRHATDHHNTAHAHCIYPDTQQIIAIQHMHTVCWITKATHTHTHTLRMCNTALPQQHWLSERTSSCLYVHCRFYWEYFEDEFNKGSSQYTDCLWKHLTVLFLKHVSTVGWYHNGDHEVWRKLQKGFYIFLHLKVNSML